MERHPLTTSVGKFMRALYLPDLKKDSKNNEIAVNDSHHLVNVVRIKENEDVMLLDGKGLRAVASVTSITKKQIVFKISSSEEVAPPLNLNLAQCLVKKEAMEDIIRMSAEAGLAQIYPLQSQHSWHLFLPETRIKAILGSALEQSNNANLPIIKEQSKLADFDFSSFDHVLYFTSDPEAAKKPVPEKFQKNQKLLILIGPEGGLSPAEEEMLFTKNNFSFVHLPTPILRAPTAVLVAIGFTLSKL